MKVREDQPSDLGAAEVLQLKCGFDELGPAADAIADAPLRMVGPDSGLALLEAEARVIKAIVVTLWERGVGAKVPAPADPKKDAGRPGSAEGRRPGTGGRRSSRQSRNPVSQRKRGAGRTQPSA